MINIEKFILIRRHRSRIRLFKPFEYINKPVQTFDAMFIYGFIL